MVAAAITLIAKEQPGAGVLIPSLSVAPLVIGGHFAFQNIVHRPAQPRAPAGAG
jgi:hypothetical protein